MKDFEAWATINLARSIMSGEVTGATAAWLAWQSAADLYERKETEACRMKTYTDDQLRRMRAEMDLWIDNEFERGLPLGLPHSETAQKEYWPLWQAAYAAGERRGLERAREICKRLGREHGEHPEWAETCAAAIEREIKP